MAKQSWARVPCLFWAFILIHYQEVVLSPLDRAWPTLRAGAVQGRSRDARCTQPPGIQRPPHQPRNPQVNPDNVQFLGPRSRGRTDGFQNYLVTKMLVQDQKYISSI